MKEGEPKFDRKAWKRSWRRVGLELDDEQLSQVPNPQVEKKPDEKPKPKIKLGSFWTDEY